MAPSKQEHRSAALTALERSTQYGYTSPARSVMLAEAQVHATLALSADSTVEPPTPLTAVPEAEEAAKPAPKRRTRKPKAEPEAKFDEVVPGSEEDLIRKEASA